jgi:hypothetical protein
MSKLFTEAGFLSDEGKRVFKETLNNNISMLLKQASSETELGIIGSLIQQRVGEMVTSAVADRKEKVTFLQKMSDDEFKEYLITKYGEDYFFKASLTPEEFDRCPVPSQEKLQEALEEGMKAAQGVMHSCFPFPKGGGPTYR